MHCCRVSLCRAAEKASKLAALTEEFPEFDGTLLSDMLDDQAGDLLEVRLYLAVGGRAWHVLI